MDDFIGSGHHPGMANRIRILRKERGWSMRELAERINVTAPTVNKLEKGWIKLNEDYLTRLARAFDCRPADLLDDEPSAQPEDVRILLEAIEREIAAHPEVAQRLTRIYFGSLRVLEALGDGPHDPAVVAAIVKSEALRSQ